MTRSTSEGRNRAGKELPDALMDELSKALSQMSFGHVTLVVQDGKVIQIEKTEKIRLSRQEQYQKT